MCFYEQMVWECRDWKWGNCKQRCNKEYRMGETCGSKFVHETRYASGKCADCKKIATKEKRRMEEWQRIQRWTAEGTNPASVEKSINSMKQLEDEIQAIELEKSRKNQAIGARGDLSGYTPQQQAYANYVATYGYGAQSYA